MKVIPTATQPINDVVFKSENRLTAVKKPGVVPATVKSVKTATRRIATSTRPRVECGSGTRQSVRQGGDEAGAFTTPDPLGE
jgi:hypothetical protein